MLSSMILIMLLLFYGTIYIYKVTMLISWKACLEYYISLHYNCEYKHLWVEYLFPLSKHPCIQKSLFWSLSVSMDANFVQFPLKYLPYMLDLDLLKFSKMVFGYDPGIVVGFTHHLSYQLNEYYWFFLTTKWIL